MKRLSHPSQLADWRARLLAERPAGRKTVVVSSGTCGQASGSPGIIDAFRRELDRRGLGERKMPPLVTLHHFTDPLWLAELGGWGNERVVEYFNAYVGKMTGDTRTHDS